MQTGLFDQIIKDNPFWTTPLIGFPVNICLRYNQNGYSQDGCTNIWWLLSLVPPDVTQDNRLDRIPGKEVEWEAGGSESTMTRVVSGRKMQFEKRLPEFIYMCFFVLFLPCAIYSSQYGDSETHPQEAGEEKGSSTQLTWVMKQF